LIILGCREEFVEENNTNPIEKKIETIKKDSLTDYFVTEEQAINVANAFFDVQAGKSGLRSSGTIQPKALVETINEQQNDKPLMYIINYPGGGGAIICATRSFYPVLAYSDKNSFNQVDMGPVEAWLTETKDAIKASEALSDSVKSEINSIWNSYTTNYEPDQAVSTFRISDPIQDALGKRISQLGSIYGYGSSYIITTLDGAQSILSSSSEWQSLCNWANSLGSPPQYTIFIGEKDYPSQTVGPLLQTKWNQVPPFNDLMPSGYPAGCAAIAVAQVMKYYQYPQSFSLNGYAYNMTDVPLPITLGSASQATLSKIVGMAVNMNYSFGASWALPGDVESGIRFLGYNVTRASHNYNLVRTQLLTYQRPVIMGGGTVNLPNPLNYLGNGHY
jgi:hypothetical protein